MIVGTVAIVIVVIGAGIALDRRVRVLPRELAEPRRPGGHGAGEAPATAIRARARQLEKIRTSQLCASCRRPMGGLADDRVRYDNHDLLVLHFACATCAARRTLYIEQISS